RLRLAHGQPAPESLEPPREHPLGLVLLRRDEADGVFVEPLGGALGFDIGDEAVLILINVDAADLLDGLLNGRHFPSTAGSRPAGRLVGYGLSLDPQVLPPAAPPQAAMPRCSLNKVSASVLQAARNRSISASCVI